tara:strand:- start:575 stop:976 length:402 start_codon:yes stop_codon:yes gene_type:complete
MYLNIYEVGKAYGGPEEGGWWYSTGEFIFGVKLPSEDAEEIEKKLRMALMDDTINFKDFFEAEGVNIEDASLDCRIATQGRVDGFGDYDGRDPEGNGDDDYLIPGGVWGTVQLRAYIEASPGESYPQERPYYC